MFSPYPEGTTYEAKLSPYASIKLKCDCLNCGDRNLADMYFKWYVQRLVGDQYVDITQKIGSVIERMDKQPVLNAQGFPAGKNQGLG